MTRLALLSLLLVACGPPGRPSPIWTQDFESNQGGLVGIAQGNGAPRFLHRVDGSVVQVKVDEYTAAEEQFAILTGTGSGLDQGSLILLDGDGTRLARYTCSGRTPYPLERPIVQVQYPHAGSFRHFVYGGKRFLTFTSIGGQAPSALVVLEATGRESVLERLACWHEGHLQQVGHGEGLLAALGLNNRMRNEYSAYGGGLVVVDLAELIQLPGDADTGTRILPELATPVVCYLEMPPDGRLGAYPRSVRIEGGRAYAQLVGGLTYVLEVATAQVWIEPSSWYASDYDERRASNPGLPATPVAHVADLLSRIVLHARRP